MPALPQDVVADLQQENARLTAELRAALDRENATADILKIIASSPSEVRPVFEAIAKRANALLGGFSTTVFRFVDGIAHLEAFTPTNPAADEILKNTFPRPIADLEIFALAQAGKVVPTPDTEALTNEIKYVARARGFRSMLFVPLVNGGTVIGMIGITRVEPGTFAPHNVQLLQTFADQAVIAIENVRLFNEVQRRTSDLTESLQQQTATADVLKVISRSAFDLQTVLDALLASACRLCEADIGTIRYRDGDEYRLAATFGCKPEWSEHFARYSTKPDRGSVFGRTIVDGHAVHIPDVLADPDFKRLSAQKLMGFKAALGVPLVREGQTFGVINLFRFAVGPFSERQIEFVQTFADQAVIAIENVRLFNAVQQRTSELAESLQQQTAIGDVLKTISRATFDLHPVLDSLVQTAARLCNADMAFIMRREGEVYRAGASVGFSREYAEFLETHPITPDRHTITGRAALERHTVQIIDVVADPEYTLRESTTLAGQRTALGVPLLRESEPIGVIVIARRSVREFTEKQIELVNTFADQAVIAIENVRLFEQLRQRTEDLSESLQQQTATANVLKVISRSAFDLQTVLDTLTESAAQLCSADMGTIARSDDRGFYHATNYNFPIDWVRVIDFIRLQPGRGSVVGRALLAAKAVQIPDVLVDPEYTYLDMQKAAGFRTVLGVPMMRETEPIGVLFLGRKTVQPFTDKQIELVSTFADQAVIAIENVRLFDEVQQRTRELTESLEYQTATGDILRVISRSPTDVQPVFDTIAESAVRLCDAQFSFVLRFDGNLMHFAAGHGLSAEGLEAFQRLVPRPADEGTTAGRAILHRAVAQIPDVFVEPVYAGRGLADVATYRSIVAVPLLRDGDPIGAIAVARAVAGPFSEGQVALLQTFADQAVIAIQNVKLFDEVQAKTRDLSEALTYQTGSANILSVIASSPTDVKPVLKAIVESACELCQAYDSVTLLKDGDDLRVSAHHGPIPMSIEKWPINRKWTAGRAFVDQKPVHVHDLLAEGTEFPDGRELSLRMGHRCILSVPLLRAGESIGAIVLRRTEVHPFSDKQIALLQTFADQAVIALGNVRMFEEVQARTRDLSEALQQQTATAEVLKVISRSAFDLDAVLRTLVESAAKLCEAERGILFLRKENECHMATNYGFSPELEAFARAHPIPIDGGSTTARAAASGVAVQAADVLADPTQGEVARQYQRLGGHRTNLGVPLKSKGETIGVFTLTRQGVRPFTEKQVELVSTFADQAVIAIENVRLFEEVQAKSRDLSEALTYQTGSANILKVIASSPTKVGPVLEAIVESACELCEAYDAVLRLRAGNDLCFSAHHGPITTFLNNRPISRNWTAGRAVIDRKPVQITDLLSSEGNDLPDAQELARRQGHRTILSVPLLREGESIGAITLRRIEVNPFSDKQINLLQTFADQAVIAIGNVRLFEQLNESLEQQTATSEVLETISASTGELEPIFDKMLENATRICGAKFGTMNLYEEGGFRTVALYNAPQAYIDTRLYKSIRPHPASGLGTVEKTHRTVHIDDIRTQPPYIEGNPNVRALADLAGARTLVIVPMLKEGELIGTITIFRQEVKSFTEKQTELVANFANQAVIAIENARLLNELRQRTAELSRSLDDLRTAQVRLIQTEKLASLGQLTAGIAHEIKNPLNFVNNFSLLSSELIDELNDALKAAALDTATREEIDEVTQTLKSNLEKVVQHGKRADSIVKNMLLHSRQGSGERRSADINAIVEESLNLAYHGARAEKSGFSITLERDLDPNAGMIELYPQEITRVFLNLISNGFYAATGRRESGGNGFEPKLSATTRNLGGEVEIRIRDNGTGIPPEVKEKIFNPFFTTKPAGEGTGLGLSMSHDIIVKQHGGRIEIRTEPGLFTEFVITLPRTLGSQTNAGGRE